MKQREIISENKLFRLIRQQRDHKTWYEIEVYASGNHVNAQLQREFTEYFGKEYTAWGQKWQFWNRSEAEKHFVYAALRWC